MIRVVMLLAALGSAVSSPTPGSRTRGAKNVEVVAMGGFAGASPYIGARGLMGYGGVSMELAGDVVTGNTAVLYPITANFLIDLSNTKTIIPYGVIGGGLFLTVPSNAIGSQSISTLGVNYGGGLRYYFSPAFGLRFESKIFLTELDAKTDVGGTRQELLSFQSKCIVRCLPMVN